MSRGVRDAAVKGDSMMPGRRQLKPIKINSSVLGFKKKIYNIKTFVHMQSRGTQEEPVKQESTTLRSPTRKYNSDKRSAPCIVNII